MAYYTKDVVRKSEDVRQGTIMPYALYFSLLRHIYISLDFQLKNGKYLTEIYSVCISNICM